MAHKTFDELARMIREAAQQVEVGGPYVHYKHPELQYRVTGFTIWEPTDEIAVLYEAQYGERLSFARPLSAWLETVEWKGATVSRFTKLPE